jgi:hypothetical protein
MAAAVIALIWLGLLLGVSFLATPVKFVVHDLTLPVALQVGQATFALFARVEWMLAAALLLAAGWAWRARPVSFALAVLVAAGVLAQATWLLPALDARVAQIVAGVSPPRSPHHTLYAGLEAAKAVLLAALAFLALRRVRQPSPQELRP